MLNCFKCKAEVVFDSEHIGKNGKKIPLDPATHAPHDCPMREKRTGPFGRDEHGEPNLQEEKDDHGNEETHPYYTVAKEIVDARKEDEKKYVDHTAAVAKGSSKAIIFFGSNPSEVTDEYNTFCARPNVKGQGAHDHVTKDDDGMLFTIFLYYEEIKQ